MELHYNMKDSGYLEHYGVLGMKWGVRNAETLAKYSRAETSLKKGTEVASVSLDPNSKHYRKHRSVMYVYNPHDKHDSAVYKGPFSKYLIYNRRTSPQQWVFEHRYTTLKDLKMPTQQQRMDEFKDLYNSKKFNKDMIKTMKNTQDQMKKYNVGPEAVRNIDLSNLKSDSDYKSAYMIFNHSMEAARSHKSTKEYMRRMSSKYDAMVDDNNKGVYNKARDPIIVFKIQSVLKEAGSAKIVMPQEIIDNTEYIRKTTGKVML